MLHAMDTYRWWNFFITIALRDAAKRQLILRVRMGMATLQHGCTKSYQAWWINQAMCPDKGKSIIQAQSAVPCRPAAEEELD
mmetsp:Transcript_31285/g.51904  ORF Transcript_31285/g.51904 Transcript_31285/m.51904 type:complete len:82 (+) Transcript_31285:42-287(+)